jgi:hypothetical protein
MEIRTFGKSDIEYNEKEKRIDQGLRSFRVYLFVGDRETGIIDEVNSIYWDHASLEITKNAGINNFPKAIELIVEHVFAVTVYDLYVAIDLKQG